MKKQILLFFCAFWERGRVLIMRNRKDEDNDDFRSLLELIVDRYVSV